MEDGGAEHFKNCVDEIRKICNAKIEILTPDFKPRDLAPQEKVQALNSYAPLDTIIGANPDCFNHNIETVKTLFSTARPQGNYDWSLEVLRYIKNNSSIVTKSGLMVGLGETLAQIEETLYDLKNVGVDIITIGQYIQPSKAHLEVAKFYTLDEFEELKTLARKVGFKNYQIGPLVRSSYHAMNSFNEMNS